VEVVANGLCEQPLQTAQECEQAVQQLELRHTGSPAAQGTDDQPAGCWWHSKNGAVFFNTPPKQDAFTTQCSSHSRCLCCGGEARPSAVCRADTEFLDVMLVRCRPCKEHSKCKPGENAQCDGTGDVSCHEQHLVMTITGIHPKSVTVGTSSMVALSGTAATGDSIIWSKHCGYRKPVSVRKVSHDLHIGTSLGLEGRYKLCYRHSFGGPFVEQVGIELEVVAATLATVITGIAPRKVTSGMPTTMYLEGAVKDGDLVAWASDCDTATPLLQPKAGTDTMTTFTFDTPGVMRLCYRSRGGSDSITQVGVSLLVVEPLATFPSASCSSEAVTQGRPFGDDCLQPVQSTEACTEVASQAFGANASAVVIQAAEDRPYGCWHQPSTENSGQGIYFNVPPPAGKSVGCSKQYQCLCCSAGAAPTGVLRGSSSR